MESTARIPCLIAVAACMSRCITPPAPAAKKQDMAQAPPAPPVERTLLYLNNIPVFNLLNAMKAGVWMPALVESAIVLANRGLLPDGWNEEFLRFLTCSPLPGRVARSFPPLLAGAAGLALFGAYIRTSAYRALGRQFTFNLALGKDFSLVTRFPYNIVRHPAYLGSVATVTGVALALAPRDGWARAVVAPWVSAAPAHPLRIAAVAYAAGLAVTNALGIFMFASRAPVEDAMLRRQFGQEWDEWAERVPYRIVPFIW